jgi:hypothetical protein
MRDLETFSGFVAFCFQIATDSDCRARSREGIIEDGGWRMEDGGWRIEIEDRKNGDPGA